MSCCNYQYYYRAKPNRRLSPHTDIGTTLILQPSQVCRWKVLAISNPRNGYPLPYASTQFPMTAYQWKALECVSGLRTFLEAV